MKNGMFQLWLDPETDNDAEIIAALRQVSACAAACLDEEGDSTGDGDWGDPRADLEELSKKYPETEITLKCDLEDNLIYIVAKEGKVIIEDDESEAV